MGDREGSQGASSSSFSHGRTLARTRAAGSSSDLELARQNILPTLHKGLGELHDVAAQEEEAEYEASTLADSIEKRMRLANPEVVSIANRWTRLWFWLLSWLVPGLGMFSEAYFVFAIGNLQPLFQAAYPQCPPGEPPPGFDPDTCVCWAQTSSGLCDVRHTVSDTLTYTLVAGIIFGQLTIGLIADRLGRKLGSIMCAAIMMVFGVLIVASSPNGEPRNMFVMFTVVQALFGIGVGGEYPVASTSASERAEQTRHLQARRGETVVLVFSCQGWGSLVNACVILALLAIFGQFYGHRILGNALSWFAWDIAFYGNKLFQSGFIEAVVGGRPTLVQTLEWVLLNSAVALAGYYAAALTIDRRWMGRVRMQMMGFAWLSALFLPCAVAYHQLTDPASSLIPLFQFLYFFSSFWGQFGPNATTWLLPAETVPTEMRARCHGFAAAVGKAGAVVAGVVFGLRPACTTGLEAAMTAAGAAPGCVVNSASTPDAREAQNDLLTAAENQRNFYISAACGIAGLLLTWALVPDLTGLDLAEGDRRWLAILEGGHADYEGPAVAPRHLSPLERYVLGYGTNYRPRNPDKAPM
eukprot:scaffold1.g5874.t1